MTRTRGTRSGKKTPVKVIQRKQEAATGAKTAAGKRAARTPNPAGARKRTAKARSASGPVGGEAPPLLTLTLLRHAKSSWNDAAMADIDRPLAGRGRKAMPLIAAFLAGKALIPDHVLCSSARRTRETLDLLIEGLPSRPSVTYSDALYLAEPSALVDQLKALPDTVRHAMIVGHNPEMQSLALSLVAEGPQETLTEIARKFPTAGLVVLTFPYASWRDLALASGTLRHFQSPRRLA
ncbi:MAG: histidine phosphatase family protein [Hyphomicrobiaceae bacterium]